MEQGILVNVAKEFIYHYPRKEDQMKKNKEQKEHAIQQRHV